ncbi:right-handed parallel beta-helix repeat-containing protein, partial [Microbacterium sp. Bi128]|uniref:NosD domain-containing protein n=1 Tax=Microbacterium sp. Bi128 TaxID=2821115 RepID=UPI001E442EE7
PTPGASSSTPEPPSSGSAAEGADCSGATVTVATARDLQEALDDATPGASILLRPGVYPGNFTAKTSGTADAPIRLCGSPDAVLDGGRVDDGYVLHLDGVAHWSVAGFGIRNGQKGIMADGVTDTTIENLTVSDIGDEAVHLRAHSSDNMVSDNVIRDTGKRRAKFGEGVYVGTAESNWCDITDCEPDRSDRNVIVGNSISGTTAESVDVKEGTTGGRVEGNVFDGAQLADDADSWVDIKGNDWIVRGNTGTDSPGDGYQTHEIVDGWGRGNVFSANVANVNGPGYGYSVTARLDNVVECNNSASGVGEGLSNVECSASAP